MELKMESFKGRSVSTSYGKEGEKQAIDIWIIQ